MNETLTALIEAIDYHKKVVGDIYSIAEDAAWDSVAFRASEAASALRASLARDAALEAFVKEVEHEADMLIADKYGISSNPERHAALIWCADRLTQILEGRK